MDQMDPDMQSISKFRCYYDSSYQILKDQQTVIGIKNKQYSRLIKERLCRDPIESNPIEFSEHQKPINTILLMEQFDSIFVGSNDCTVIQYQIGKDGQTPKLLKNYGDIGIEWIYASVSCYNLAIFGGDENKLIIISADQNQVVSDAKVAIKYICSLVVCPVNVSGKRARVLISVSGRVKNYSKNQSDLLDMTECLEAAGQEIEVDDSENILQTQLEEANKMNQKYKSKYEKYKAKYKEGLEKLDLEKRKYEKVLTKNKRLKYDLIEIQNNLAQLKTKYKSAKRQKKKLKKRSKDLIDERHKIFSNKIRPVLAFNQQLSKMVKFDSKSLK